MLVVTPEAGGQPWPTDWRESDVALARGEETGGEVPCDTLIAAKQPLGSDRRVRQRREEPPPVGHNSTPTRSIVRVTDAIGQRGGDNVAAPDCNATVRDACGAIRGAIAKPRLVKGRIRYVYSSIRNA
jgi:hypothetical protein